MTSTPHSVTPVASASPTARAALVAALDDAAWLDRPPAVGAALVDAITATAAPPCEGCPERARCGRERLACADFCVYVTTGSKPRRARRPDRNLYAALFNG